MQECPAPMTRSLDARDSRRPCDSVRHADLLLIDETLGRKAAALRGIHITGTIGIIEQAAEQGLLDLKEAFAQIKMTDFWIFRELLDARLKLYLLRGQWSRKFLLKSVLD